jgi:predicted Zn-dependent peptidase
MKYLCPICLYIALMLSFAQLKAQDNSNPPATIYRVVKASNGQSLLLCHAPGSTVYTDIYFRMGPIYEFDSVSGISLILSKIISAHIDARLQSSGKKINYYSSVEPEQIAFHFESGLADLDYLLGVAHDEITQPTLDKAGLNEAKALFKADLDSSNANASYKSEANIESLLWGSDYTKLNIYGDHRTYARITLDELIAFHHKYFLPFNNMISVVGAYSDNRVLDQLQNAFKDFKSKEFDPELITRVIDFKPVINNVQIIAPASGPNIAMITYQNPGARQDRQATYSAFVFSEMMNDTSGRIQKAVRQAGLTNLKSAYICNNFYGTFQVSVQIPGNNFYDAFTILSGLMNDITRKGYFKEGEVEKAEKDIEIEYQGLKDNHLKDFMSLITRYRFSNDENYFAAMGDSINDVSVDAMRGYVTNYFADHAAIKCLFTSAGALRAAPAAQQYFALNDSIENIKFTYDLNKTDVESDEAKLNLARLIQWLRINPDIHVQINGYADEGEFKKAYDDTVKRFIDSTATFHKAMPDAFKKGYLRIEMMRAMKIAKAIYEAGITEDRITGTSMVFTSETPEGAAANRKCTVTLEKIKPRESLYEYHFGKEKPQDPNAGRGPTLILNADR